MFVEWGRLCHGTMAQWPVQAWDVRVKIFWQIFIVTAPLQTQSVVQFWLDRESSDRRLSQLALDLVASPASQAYFERLFSWCVVSEMTHCDTVSRGSEERSSEGKGKMKG